MTGTNPNTAAGGPQGAAQAAAPQGGIPGQQAAILGLSVDQLAGLSIDEIAGNKVAITMVLHYYKQLLDENTALKNERNTLSTYVDGYKQKKSDARMGAALLTLSNIFLGFGINLLTSEAPRMYGLAMFVPGVLMTIVGFYFSVREE